MKSSRVIPIYLLLAMGLALVPAPLHAACGQTPHPEVDPCDTLLTASLDASTGGSGSDHGEDNCCETGCLHCSLPCCSGTAMILTFAQLQDAAPTADGRLALTDTALTWVDTNPLYHPPRV